MLALYDRKELPTESVILFDKVERRISQKLFLEPQFLFSWNEILKFKMKIFKFLFCGKRKNEKKTGENNRQKQPRKIFLDVNECQRVDMYLAPEKYSRGLSVVQNKCAKRSRSTGGLAYKNHIILSPAALLSRSPYISNVKPTYGNPENWYL